MSDNIRFACPRCNLVLKAPIHKGGHKVACPKCQQELQIPIVFQDLDSPASAFQDNSPLRKPRGGKQPVLGLVSLVLSWTALGTCFFGCLLYLVLWRSATDIERLALTLGEEYPGNAKFLLPRVLNYVSFSAAMTSIILGIIGLALGSHGKAQGAIFLSSVVLLLLLAFWIWTVSRKPPWMNMDDGRTRPRGALTAPCGWRFPPTWPA
jgi:hypothetical protein